MRIFIPLFLVLIAGSSLLPGNASKAAEPQLGCLTAREFITTLEFLRDRKEFGISEQNARKIAQEVAHGCTGAAARYIRVSRTLTLAGLGTGDALKIALELSKRTEREAESFLDLFKTAYAHEGLDFDLASSLELARALSIDFPGDILKARDDFETIVRYCTDAKKLALPKPQCASFAREIASQGQNWAGSASSAWIQMYEFLAFSKEGPTLTADQALRVAKLTIQAGPDSADNFVHGFRYASSKKGLDLPRDQAVAFAHELAFGALKTSK